MKKEEFDFEAFSKQASEDLKAGKPMIGKNGIFTPLLKRLIEVSLEGELSLQTTIRFLSRPAVKNKLYF